MEIVGRFNNRRDIPFEVSCISNPVRTKSERSPARKCKTSYYEKQS
jgi:hypothetical protein